MPLYTWRVLLKPEPFKFHLKNCFNQHAKNNDLASFFFFLLSVQIFSLLTVELPLGRGHEGCYWNIRLHCITQHCVRDLNKALINYHLSYKLTICLYKIKHGVFVFLGILSQVYEELVVKRRTTKNNTLEKSFLIYFRLFSLTLLTWHTVNTVKV